MHRGILAPLSLGAMFGLAAPAAAEVDVDLELVLAVDISRSMDDDEQQLQRDGYVAALRHPEVIEAIHVRPGRPDRRHLCRMGGPVLSGGGRAVDDDRRSRRGRGLRRAARGGADHPRARHLDLRRAARRRSRCSTTTATRHAPGDRRLRRRAEQHGRAGDAGARPDRRGRASPSTACRSCSSGRAATSALSASPISTSTTRIASSAVLAPS